MNRRTIFNPDAADDLFASCNFAELAERDPAAVGELQDQMLEQLTTAKAQNATLAAHAAQLETRVRDAEREAFAARVSAVNWQAVAMVAGGVAFGVGVGLGLLIRGAF